MIPFFEQIKYIIYFLLFGMFIAIMYDFLHFYLKKYRVKLLLSYPIQLIYWIGLVYLACIYMLKITEGYLTIYTYGFFLIGVIIHMIFLSKRFVRDITRLDQYLNIIYQKAKMVFIIIIFPKEVYWFVSKVIKGIIRIISSKCKTIRIKIKKKRIEMEEAKYEEVISFFDDVNSFNGNGLPGK